MLPAFWSPAVVATTSRADCEIVRSSQRVPQFSVGLGVEFRQSNEAAFRAFCCLGVPGMISNLLLDFSCTNVVLKGLIFLLRLVRLSPFAGRRRKQCRPVSMSRPLIRHGLRVLHLRKDGTERGLQDVRFAVFFGRKRVQDVLTTRYRFRLWSRRRGATLFRATVQRTACPISGEIMTFFEPCADTIRARYQNIPIGR